MDKFKSVKYKVILILLILGGLVFVLVPRFYKSPPNVSPGDDEDSFVVAHPFDLSQIRSFTKYRSCAGHNYSGKTVDGEVENNRSMKHYVHPLDSIVQSKTEIPIYAPFDGNIYEVSAEGADYQVWLTPNQKSLKKWSLIFFHVFLDDGFKENSKIVAGERIGRVNLMSGGNFDIGMKQITPFSPPLFDAPLKHFSSQILADYMKRGMTLENSIISKEYRDKNPCSIVPGTEGIDARFPSGVAESEMVFLQLHQNGFSAPTETLLKPDMRYQEITPEPRAKSKTNAIAPQLIVSEQKPTCVSDPSPIFTHHITDMSKVNYIGPPPTMGAGPSLKTHSYIGTDHARVPIYAPTALTLESGSYYIGGPYMMEFRASCEVRVRFGHITEPAEAIKQLLPSEPKQDSRTQELAPVTFAAGELIGYTTGTDAAGNWDFGVYNSTVSNRYADDPNWNNSTTYTTAVCPFDYFTESLRSVYVLKFNSAMLAGNPPHGEPFCQQQDDY